MEGAAQAYDPGGTNVHNRNLEAEINALKNDDQVSKDLADLKTRLSG